MEKKLVKSAVYSFIASFAIFVAFRDQNPLIQTPNGMYTSYHIALGDYFLMILKDSIKVSLVVIFIVLLIEFFKKFKNKN